jgi:hypothetical protein
MDRGQPQHFGGARPVRVEGMMQVNALETLESTFRTPEYALFAIFSDPDDLRLFLA